MKFIKNNFKIIIAFILTIILTSSVSIYAAVKYNSNEVLYLASNGRNITVETALDDLYAKNTQTLENLLNRIDALENGTNTTYLNKVYPVGSIYISTSSTNPGTLFGGTWQAYGTGRTLVGIDSSQTEFNTAGKTGGEKTHTLTVNEMPSHSHIIGHRGEAGSASTYMHGDARLSALYESNYRSSSEGGSQSHNNLQPYIVVYMWRRTA